MEIDNSSKTFFENIFDGDNFQPSASIEKSFMQSFEGAINIEWVEYEEHLEAIFYKDKVEHIALFSKDGILHEYRKSLPEGYLPYNVRKQMEAQGEIMNRVLINKGNTIQYEILIRDANLERHLFIMSDLGELIKHRPL